MRVLNKILINRKREGNVGILLARGRVIVGATIGDFFAHAHEKEERERREIFVKSHSGIIV